MLRSVCNHRSYLEAIRLVLAYLAHIIAFRKLFQVAQILQDALVSNSEQLSLAGQLLGHILVGGPICQGMILCHRVTKVIL